jgi:hypothetical protein
VPRHHMPRCNRVAQSDGRHGSVEGACRAGTRRAAPRPGPAPAHLSALSRSTWASGKVTTTGVPSAWPGGSSEGSTRPLLLAPLPLRMVAGSTLTSTSTTNAAAPVGDGPSPSAAAAAAPLALPAFSKLMSTPQLPLHPRPHTLSSRAMGLAPRGRGAMRHHKAGRRVVCTAGALARCWRVCPAAHSKQARWVPGHLQQAAPSHAQAYLLTCCIKLAPSPPPLLPATCCPSSPPPWGPPPRTGSGVCGSEGCTHMSKPKVQLSWKHWGGVGRGSA